MTTDVFDTAVLRTELRLFRREPGALFWMLVFPTLLLAILGSIPSFREADPPSADCARSTPTCRWRCCSA